MNQNRHYKHWLDLCAPTRPFLCVQQFCIDFLWALVKWGQPTS